MAFNEMTAKIGLDSKPFEAGIKRVSAASDQFRKKWESNNRRMGSGGIFNRYEKSNLTSQGIDIASGLATGQNPMTILLQQGGQVADLLMRRQGGLLQGVKDLGKALFNLRNIKIGGALAVIFASGAKVLELLREIKAVGTAQTGLGNARADLTRSQFSRVDIAQEAIKREFAKGNLTEQKHDELRKKTGQAWSYAQGQSPIQGERITMQEGRDQAQRLLSEVFRQLTIDEDLLASQITLRRAQLDVEIDRLQQQKQFAETEEERRTATEALFKKEKQLIEDKIKEQENNIIDAKDEKDRNLINAKLALLKGDLERKEKAFQQEMKPDPEEEKQALFKPQSDSLSAIGGGAAGSSFRNWNDGLNKITTKLDSIDRTLKGDIKVKPSETP